MMESTLRRKVECFRGGRFSAWDVGVEETTLANNPFAVEFLTAMCPGRLGGVPANAGLTGKDKQLVGGRRVRRGSSRRATFSRRSLFTRRMPSSILNPADIGALLVADKVVLTPGRYGRRSTNRQTTVASSTSSGVSAGELSSSLAISMAFCFMAPKSDTTMRTSWSRPAAGLQRSEILLVTVTVNFQYDKGFNIATICQVSGPPRDLVSPCRHGHGHDGVVNGGAMFRY